MTDPTFLVIGAARSGTTTLHHCLGQHPEVFVPRDKQPEPHFFYKRKEYEKGLAWYREHWFAACGDERAVGEVSSSYLFSAAAAERIARCYPDMQLVCTLRDPVERAHSSYWHSVRNGLETLSFEEAIATEPARLEALEGDQRELAPFSYVGRGLYGPQLRSYLEHFPAGQIHVMLFDDLVARPAETLRGLFAFLGVDPDVEIAGADEATNASTPPGKEIDPLLRERLAARFEDSNRLLAELIGRELPGWGG